MTSQSTESNYASRNELKQNLAQTAEEFLQSQGHEGFSLKKIAERCDVSTQMIYTIFGGKTGLIREVYKRLTDDLADRFAELPDTDDPIKRLYEFTIKYRQFALANRYIYDEVFRVKVAEDYGGNREIIRRSDVFQKFVDSVNECRDKGYIDKSSPIDSVVESLWGSAHGLITLEISGYYPDSETARTHFVKTMIALIEGYGDLETYDFPDDISV